MNDRIIKLLPKVTVLVLLALCVIVGAMFYLGGSAGSMEVAGDYLDIPRFTDLFMVFTYILLGLAIVVTLCSVVISFSNRWATDRKGAIRTLCAAGAFVLLLIICWFAGSTEEVPILGYEGHDNVGLWAKFADATMFATYALLALTVLAILGGWIYNKVKE